MNSEFAEGKSIDASPGIPRGTVPKARNNDVPEPSPPGIPTFDRVKLPVRSVFGSCRDEGQPVTILTAVVVPPEPSVPEAEGPSVPGAERPNVLEAAKTAARAFLSKTAEALLKHTVTRLIDLIAPGVGAMITALEHVVSAVQDARAIGNGSGDLSFPVGTFGGFEFKAEVHVGDDSGGPDQHFGAFIAPYEGDSLFDQLDIAPNGSSRYAAAVSVDLSKLPELPDANSRFGAIRSYTEGEVLPYLRRYPHGGEVELVYMHDEKAGIGAWVRVTGLRTSWAVYIWKSAATRAIPC